MGGTLVRLCLSLALTLGGAVLFSPAAFAVDGDFRISSCGGACAGGGPLVPGSYASPDAAGAAILAHFCAVVDPGCVGHSYTTSVVDAGSKWEIHVHDGGPSLGWWADVNFYCPDASTYGPATVGGATCTVPGGATCNAGDFVDLYSPSGYDTVPNPAVGSGIAVTVPSTKTLCEAGCVVQQKSELNADGVAPATTNYTGRCQTASTPGVTGMYQTSCLYRYEVTAAACTTELTAAANLAAATPPVCTGSLGTAAGQTVCLPIAGTPSRATPPAPVTVPPGVQQVPTDPDVVHTPDSAGGGRGGGGYPNPASASGGIQAGGGGAIDGASPGVASSEGRGASTTCTNPAGCSGSGPGGAGANVQVDVELNTCGGPGQPPCKIDETGTPDGSGSFDASNAALDAGATAVTDAISGTATAPVTSLGFSFVWSPPSGTCSSIPFGTATYFTSWDWCVLLGRVRALWAWAVSIFAALYIWRKATSAIGGT